MKFRFLFSYLVVTLTLFGVIFTFSTTFAQSSNSILVNMTPSNPDPYENVNITLKSYVYDLDTVLISWSVDGKTTASGTGKKSFSVTAPAAGKEVGVVATLSLPDGITETKIMIRPSVLVLLWQANDSYVPPFYKGKALPTPDSEIKVVAMPEVRNGSSLVSPQNMTYRWKKDYTNNVDGSGYGKNSFIYVNDYLEDSNNISVVATTVDQNFSTDASIDIGSVQPKILFYKNDTTLGTEWQNALTDTHTIQGPEIVEAVPYFISPKEILNPTLVWNWFINDDRVNLTSFKKNLMPLQVEPGVHGVSKLKLEIENRYKIFQTTDKEITIEF